MFGSLSKAIIAYILTILSIVLLAAAISGSSGGAMLATAIMLLLISCGWETLGILFAVLWVLGVFGDN